VRFLRSARGWRHRNLWGKLMVIIKIEVQIKKAKSVDTTYSKIFLLFALIKKTQHGSI